MKIEIYTKSGCPFCFRAKILLDKKNVKYIEHDAKGSEVWDIMTNRSGRNTVPQIFINDEHIGGCDDLHALDTKGELDKKLGK